MVQKIANFGRITLQILSCKKLAGGKLGGWMDGWMGGWVDGKAGLRIAYSNKKYMFFSCVHVTLF